MSKLTDIQKFAMEKAKRSTEFQKEVIRIAKRLDVSVVMNTDKEIEFIEKDRDKVHKFINAIRGMNESVKLSELYSIGMHKDTKGYDASEDKSLYQVDDDYYRRLVEEVGLG